MIKIKVSCVTGPNQSQGGQMIHLSWNCRGLNSADFPSIPYLCWLVRKHAPTVVFLSEAEVDELLISKLYNILGFTNVVACSANGTSEGLALFWVTM